MGGNWNMAKNPNNDVKTLKRSGILDAENMTIEYKDEKTEETSIYKISTPFHEYDGQEVKLSISIEVVAKEIKTISHDGELLVDNEE